MVLALMPVAVTSKAWAAEDSIRTIANSYLTDFVNYGYANKITVDRRAGTYGEALAATVIQNYLSALTASIDTEGDESIKLVAKNNSSTVDGIQKFEFVNPKASKKEKSQNIIYTLKGKSSDKKVVLTTNYDNYWEGYISQNDQIITEGEEFSEGVNASAASVAVLLTLAEILPLNSLEYDVEFVFLGAKYADNAGTTYYTQTLSKEERDSILLLADISSVALGNNLYFYSGAFGSKQDKFYKDTLKFKQYTSRISGSSEETDTKLGYTNAGYNGTTTLTENSGYNILHIFAGDYESGVFSGEREYAGLENITNTSFDSLDYIFSKHGSDVSRNMEKAINGLLNLLTNSKFVSELKKSNSSAGYNFFNYHYTGIIMLVTLLILVAITIIMQYKYNKKAYDFIVDNQITNVAIKLDDEEKDQ